MQETNGLDALDFSILSYLQQDGRMSFTVIAEKLNVSIGTVRTRFNKLIEDGTINIIGRVDPSKVGFHCYAHIAVYVRPAGLKEKVATQIAKLKEVDVTGVEATAHAFPLVNVTRPDVAGEPLPHDEALANAPSRSGGLFVVPKIVE